MSFVPDIPLEQYLGHFDNQNGPNIPCDIFFFGSFGQTNVAVKDRLIQREVGEGQAEGWENILYIECQRFRLAGT